MNLAYQPGVDGCITVCYIYRAAQQDARRPKRGVAFASNDQSKCFGRMQLGTQLLYIRLFYQPNADDTSRMHKLRSELMRRSVSSAASGPRAGRGSALPHHPRCQSGHQHRVRQGERLW